MGQTRPYPQWSKASSAKKSHTRDLYAPVVVAGAAKFGIVAYIPGEEF